jgi:hypothetical protein
MSAIPSPALALTRAFDRLERSSARVINAAQSADGAELPTAIVDQMDAKAQARAAIALVKFSDEMTKALLDLARQPR